MRALRACLPALEQWAAATGPRDVLVTGPCSLAAVAAGVDLVLVAGSSPWQRLVELAEREGTAAHLVEDASEIDLRWLAGTTRLAITADAPHLVAQIVHCLTGLGPVRVSRPRLNDEAPS